MPVAPVAQPRAETVHFARVVAQVEPVAERLCRARGVAVCDFRIVVDDRPGLAPNAFQTVDRQGRPVIGFTASLIETMRNDDELAFVMGHEAAHHVAGHLARTRQSAMAGAVLGGLLGVLAGVDAQSIDTFQNLGATVGARTYSKEFELEADRVGTAIAYGAGYDPLKGAAYFARIPDPGDQFLGTHPPNGARLQAVRETVVALR